MSNDANPEYNPSGYPDSSPAEGAEQGEPPAPERHEPSPEHPRFNEVYRNWKEEARRNEELERRLSELESQSVQPEIQPTYQSQPQSQPGEEDETAWLRQIIREETQAVTAPIRETMDQQRERMELAQKVSRFRQAHPDYDDSRDSEILTHTMRKYGLGDNFDAGYRIAFPERIVGASQEPSAPVSDVRGVSANVPAESPEALMQRFSDPNISEAERAALAAKITDMGAFGGAAAERALGF